MNKNLSPNTLLDIATKNNDTDGVKSAIIKGADIERIDILLKFTPLMDAVLNKNFSLIEFLISKGANVNANNKKISVLYLACSYRYLDIVKYLIDHKVDINLKMNDGMTALMFACEQNKLGVVKILVEYGADVNLKNNKNLTAYDIAVNNKHNLIIDFLKSKMFQNNLNF